ncbi:hypothetical protein PoB_004243900 [Plakobranchus ocellatus]|uniref:Uncharacterized protein n=1 Tax=Plakobranchus ocellatus TaxID=259542 RepID=A0AAV4B797_9GAST|nr:hypothetical protein PoB_004243900 [Plakobranchus ocellatus]
MSDNPLSPTYWREANTWATTHCRPRSGERQYMGDNPRMQLGGNPQSPTYCRKAAYGRQPTYCAWVTTHCRPLTGERQYMGDNPLSPT